MDFFAGQYFLSFVLRLGVGLQEVTKRFVLWTRSFDSNLNFDLNNRTFGIRGVLLTLHLMWRFGIDHNLVFVVFKFLRFGSFYDFGQFIVPKKGIGKKASDRCLRNIELGWNKRL